MPATINILTLPSLRIVVSPALLDLTWTVREKLYTNGASAAMNGKAKSSTAYPVARINFGWPCPRRPVNVEREIKPPTTDMLLAQLREKSHAGMPIRSFNSVLL